MSGKRRRLADALVSVAGRAEKSPGRTRGEDPVHLYSSRFVSEMAAIKNVFFSFANTTDQMIPKDAALKRHNPEASATAENMKAEEP